MRMMLTAQFPVEMANDAISGGRFPKVIQATLDRVKPEAAYFTSMNGDRTAIIVFDLAHPPDIPSICEPLFVELHAAIDLAPVMTADDVAAGLAKANAG